MFFSVLRTAAYRSFVVIDSQRLSIHNVLQKQTQGVLLEDKLKLLLTDPASAGVLTTAWLRQVGYSSQLVSKYVHSGWLTSIDHGAYVRDADCTNRQHGLHALQTQLELPVWLGA